MGKTERLWKMKELLNRRSSVSLKELCRQYHVSERTIYRDLRSLERMKVSILFDGEYRLAKPKREAKTLSPDQVDLVIFCLRNNPLVNYSFFRASLRKIEAEFQQLAGGQSKRFLESQYVRLPPLNSECSVNRTKCDRWLRLFLSACSAGKMVNVMTRSSSSQSVTFRPLNVLLNSSGPILCVETQGGERREISLRQVIHLRYSP